MGVAKGHQGHLYGIAYSLGTSGLKISVKFCEYLAVGLYVRAAPPQHPSRNTSTDTIKQQLPCSFLLYSLTASSVF